MNISTGWTILRAIGLTISQRNSHSRSLYCDVADKETPITCSAGGSEELRNLKTCLLRTHSEEQMGLCISWRGMFDY